MKFRPTHFIKRTMVPVQIIGYDKGTLMEDESFLPKSNKSRKALFLCQKIIASNRINFKERGIRINLISIRLKSKNHGVF